MLFFRQPVDETALIRRMRVSRLRQRAIALLSFVAAAFVLLAVTPTEIGGFSYYGISALLVLNAVFAIRQSSIVIKPIETLLRRMRGIEKRVDENKFALERLYTDADDEFSCLAAGMDSLIEKLSDRARVAGERELLNYAMLRAVPFTMFSVSRSGKVYKLIKDPYKLVPFLKVKVGKQPSDDNLGAENLAIFLNEVKESFDTGELRWFDFDIGAHHLRGCVQSINDLTALVCIGDLPAIDRLAAKDADTRPSVTDFSHHQESMRHFAATVAHDTKNIFAALNNLLELDRDTKDPILREQIPMIDEAITRGTRLMQEIMTFSGQAHYNFAPVKATEFFRDLLDNPAIRPLIKDNIQLVIDIPDDLPYIDVDQEQLWKVPLNLVKNAVEAIGSASGRIGVKVERFEMTEDEIGSFHHADGLRMGPGILVTRSDDGPGMAMATQRHLFDPFYSNKGGGRGLGLPTALSIVVAHGGAMRVKSDSGKGSTFQTWLPVSRNSPEELKMMREIAPNGEIVLVDDDPAILRTTKLVLKMLKIAAHPAATEADAIRKMHTLNKRIKAVMVDAHLGGFSSANLVRSIHEHFPKVLIILTSGSTEESLRTDFANAPYDRFLEKPYSVADLTAALGTPSPH